MQGVDRPSDRALLVALNGAPGLSRAALCRLGLDLSAWRDGLTPDACRALAARFSISLDSLQTALDCRAGANTALAHEEQSLGRLGGRIVTCLEEAYPGRLRDLPLPPPVLEIAGALALDGFKAAPAAQAPSRVANTASVAIVGSRRATAYGLEVATWLARELADSGVVVVSGFAKGIDAAAHEGALAARNGRTIGVLGCGLPFDYPKGHRELGARIRRHGALVSEFPCALPPAPGNFPIRNRIIAALAEIVVVVEAAVQSGSLITARLALDLGREVLAVPGRVTDEQALGTNDLLRDGAAPVTHPADILERLGLATPGSARSADSAGSAGSDRSDRSAASDRPGHSPGALPPGLPATQTAIFAALDPAREQSVDGLAAAAEIGIGDAVAALLELELSGWAIRTAGGGYRRRGS